MAPFCLKRAAMGRPPAVMKYGGTPPIHTVLGSRPAALRRRVALSTFALALDAGSLADAASAYAKTFKMPLPGTNASPTASNKASSGPRGIRRLRRARRLSICGRAANSPGAPRDTHPSPSHINHAPKPPNPLLQSVQRSTLKSSRPVQPVAQGERELVQLVMGLAGLLDGGAEGIEVR
jgi:hypothetical protein